MRRKKLYCANVNFDINKRENKISVWLLWLKFNSKNQKFRFFQPKHVGPFIITKLHVKTTQPFSPWMKKTIWKSYTRACATSYPQMNGEHLWFRFSSETACQSCPLKACFLLFARAATERWSAQSSFIGIHCVTSSVIDDESTSRVVELAPRRRLIRLAAGRWNLRLEREEGLEERREGRRRKIFALPWATWKMCLSATLCRSVRLYVALLAFF